MVAREEDMVTCIGGSQDLETTASSPSILTKSRTTASEREGSGQEPKEITCGAVDPICRGFPEDVPMVESKNPSCRNRVHLQCANEILERMHPELPGLTKALNLEAILSPVCLSMCLETLRNDGAASLNVKDKCDTALRLVHGEPPPSKNPRVS